MTNYHETLIIFIISEWNLKDISDADDTVSMAETKR